MTQELVKKIVSAIEEKKGSSIQIIDIRHISCIADYFIIAEGSNRNQIQAIVDNIEKELACSGVVPKQTEGYNTANWILMDYSDIIIHIFDHENREFYNLERIWRDGKFLSVNDIV